MAELIPFFFLSLAHGSSVYSPTGSVQRVEAHAPQGSTCEIKKFKSGRSSQEWLPERHEAGARKGPWGRSAERAGCGLQAVLPQQEATWAEFTCADTAQKHFSHSPSNVFCPRIQASHLAGAAEGRHTQSAAGPRIASYKAAKKVSAKDHGSHSYKAAKR